jgi:hypothetical protein
MEHSSVAQGFGADEVRLLLAVVAGWEFVSARLTPAAYAHGLALALPEKVVVARPTGVGHALTTYRIPIEGRDEWVAAARVRSA